MCNYLRRWHTTQLTASQVLQPHANNDSWQIHYTFSLVYVFSHQGKEIKNKKKKKERKGEENCRATHLQLPPACCSPGDSRVRLRSSREESGHGSSEHQLSRFIWKTDQSKSKKGHSC